MAADLYPAAGSETAQDSSSAEADRLAAAVLGLYAPGKGYWYSMHRDGSRVEMRHCYDFLTVSDFMTENLSPKMGDEMVAFVERELLTKNWMRAQSLADVAAEESDRADHGPLGAYDGWLPRTMDGMCNLGHFDSALAFLRRSEVATHEGAYAQAHELYGPKRREHDAPVRIAERDCVCRESSGGVAFANTVIRSFFGYRPGLGGGMAIFAAGTPRGFEGKLLHVRQQDKLYTITSSGNGLSFEAERPARVEPGAAAPPDGLPAGRAATE